MNSNSLQSQIEELMIMFPLLDKELILTVIENTNGSIDQAIDYLLILSSETYGISKNENEKMEKHENQKQNQVSSLFKDERYSGNDMNKKSQLNVMNEDKIYNVSNNSNNKKSSTINKMKSKSIYKYLSIQICTFIYVHI